MLTLECASFPVSIWNMVLLLTSVILGEQTDRPSRSLVAAANTVHVCARFTVSSCGIASRLVFTPGGTTQFCAQTSSLGHAWGRDIFSCFVSSVCLFLMSA